MSHHRQKKKKFNKIILGVFQIFVFILSLAAYSASRMNGIESHASKDQTMKKGIYEKTLKLKDGRILRYAVSFPDLKENIDIPLVVALHYGGEVTPYYGKGFLKILAEPAYRGLKAIILAPDCPGRGWTDSGSESAVLELMDFTQQNWRIDSSRVVITGFSMGGIGTWYLSGRHPELFCAAIPIAARPHGEIKTIIPTFIVHGKKDEVISYKYAAEAADELKAKGVRVELILVELSHYQTQAYVGPVSKAVKWLKELWSEQK